VALAVLALLLGAPGAWAAGGVVKVAGQTAGTVYKFGRADCTAGTKISFSWDLSAVTGTNVYVTGTALKVWETQTSGCTAPATTGEQTYVVTSALTGTTNPIGLADFLGTDTCASSTSSSANPGSALLCLGYYNASTSSGSYSEVASASLQYAMANPSVPTAVSVAAGDGLLRISWAAGNTKDSIDHYEIYVVDDPNPSGSADAGASDAGSSDAGTSDAGTSDAGTSDAGSSDAGTADAGTADAGASSDPFANAAVVASPSTPGTTVVDHSSSGTALVNGSHYLVRLRAVDTYTNNSDYTAAIGGTPTPIDDFYSYYLGEHGTAQGGGGCGAAGAGWTAAVLLLGWLAVRRRRGPGRGGTALLVFALVSGAAAAALADEPAPAPSAPSSSRPAPDPAALGPQFKPLTRPSRVPRVFLFALKLDRYDPQIDSQPGLKNDHTGAVGTPYHDIFGTRIPLRVQGEVSWVVLQRPWLGTLLAGGTVGFWQNIGRGRYSTLFTDSNGVQHNPGDVSDDTALLDIWPLGAVATYRLDQLADRYRWFPLVPYAQAGLTAALWASYNGAGKISNGTTDKPGHGSGWTYGYTAALGVAVALDVIDPMLSNEAYVDLGLQRTSLFAEYGWTKLDDFSGGRALILSDRQWRFGLSLEF
jgi:uncharacterized protein (TIGR03382 family)